MKPIRQLSLFSLTLLLSLLLAAPALAGAAGKKALLLVAKDDFEDVEYTTPRKAFDEAGMACTVASTKTGTLKGRRGARIQSDMEMKDVNVADYDAVVVIGGGGMIKLWKNGDAMRIVREAADQGKIVAAICAGPGLLASAGVLKGKKATANLKSGAKPSMIRYGCTFSMDPVVVDGNVITANGPDAAKGFAEAVVAALN